MPATLLQTALLAVAAAAAYRETTPKILHNTSAVHDYFQIGWRHTVWYDSHRLVFKRCCALSTANNINSYKLAALIKTSHTQLHEFGEKMHVA
jgi:hypothetical protein